MIGKFDTQGFQDIFRNTGGHAESVLLDEVHAYTLSGSTKLKVAVDENMKHSLEILFSEYAEHSNNQQ